MKIDICNKFNDCNWCFDDDIWLIIIIHIICNEIYWIESIMMIFEVEIGWCLMMSGMCMLKLCIEWLIWLYFILFVDFYVLIYKCDELIYNFISVLYLYIIIFVMIVWMIYCLNFMIIDNEFEWWCHIWYIYDID